MFLSKKKFIIISIILLAVISTAIVLLVVLGGSNSNSTSNNTTNNGNTTDTEQEETEKEETENEEPSTPLAYSIEVNNENYETGTSNDIHLKVGQEYSFNLKGVDRFDYEIEVNPFLPTSKYEFILYFTFEQCEKYGIKYSSGNISSNGLVVRGFSTLSNDFKKHFNVVELSDKITFKNEYYDLYSFLSNAFSFGYELDYLVDNIFPNLLEVHCFKMNVRKVSTDELISFVLYFER